MIARVSLEIALRREFDYAIPAEFADKVDVGSRVQVPFGPRKVLGVVTAVAEESAQTNLKPILKVIGAQTLVTAKVLKLARWIGEYYCCAPETALKSVLPEAVRQEKAGWRERLFVRALLPAGEPQKLPKRQQQVWEILLLRLRNGRQGGAGGSRSAGKGPLAGGVGRARASPGRRGAKTSPTGTAGLGNCGKAPRTGGRGITGGGRNNCRNSAAPR